MADGQLQPGTPIPPTNPIQVPQGAVQQAYTPPTAPTDPNIVRSLLQASQLGQQTYQQQLQKMQQLADYKSALQNYQSTLAAQSPKPFSGFSYESPAGKGFLGGLGTALTDVGKGVVQGLSYTPTGRDVVAQKYARESEPWKERQALTAQQIAGIQEEMGTREKVLESASQLQYRPITAGAQMERAEAAQLNAQNQGLYQSMKVSLQQRAQQLEAQVATGKLSQEQYATQMRLIGQDVMASAMNNVAGTYADQRDRDAQAGIIQNQYKVDVENMLKEGIARLFGGGPQQPSTMGVPPAGPKVSGTKPSANSPKGRTTRNAAPQPQHVPGGSAGLPEGSTGKGSDGKPYVVKGGKWVPRSQ